MDRAARRMKIIGITGPTGAGKTTALRAVVALGGCVIDCDQVYHQLLEESAAMRNELTERFGRGILDSEQRLDRKKLGALVFQSKALLADLNTITHRYVRQRVEELLRAARAEGRPLAAVDAIALIESGLGDLCDAVVAILAPPEVRVRRIMARDGISEDYARMRVKAQQSDAFFRQNCTAVLENTGEEAEFARQAKALFEKILNLGAEIRPE